MTDILERLEQAMHQESALHSPRTTAAIEAMREAISEIESLRRQVQHLYQYNARSVFKT
jgi:hypothetical protein